MYIEPYNKEYSSNRNKNRNFSYIPNLQTSSTNGIISELQPALFPIVRRDPPKDSHIAQQKSCEQTGPALTQNHSHETNVQPWRRTRVNQKKPSLKLSCFQSSVFAVNCAKWWPGKVIKTKIELTLEYAHWEFGLKHVFAQLLHWWWFGGR